MKEVSQIITKHTTLKEKKDKLEDKPPEVSCKKKETTTHRHSNNTGIRAYSEFYRVGST